MRMLLPTATVLNGNLKKVIIHQLCSLMQIPIIPIQQLHFAGFPQFDLESVFSLILVLPPQSSAFFLLK